MVLLLWIVAIVFVWLLASTRSTGQLQPRFGSHGDVAFALIVKHIEHPR
jgi:hypothetical protein